MRPCFGLSRPEYNVQLCLIYFGEVGNGGLTQYFMNRGCRLVADTCDAFDEIGFSELAEPLQSAAAAWQDAGDDGTLPVGLDQAAGLVADIDCKLLDYIRRNADDILVSERKSQPYEQPNA